MSIYKNFILIILSTLLYSNEIKIMPLGDSITYDNNYKDITHTRPIELRHGYRNYLWYKLKQANYQVDFVGSKSSGQHIKPNFDTDNEGHPGWTSCQIAANIYSFLLKNQADIILLHIGTNDNNTSVTCVEKIFDEVKRYQKVYRKNIKIITALILDNKNHNKQHKIFNNNLKNLVLKRIKQGDTLKLVDMMKGAKINYKLDMEDLSHPNNVGYEKMANLWFYAITNIRKTKLEYTDTNKNLLKYKQRKYLLSRNKRYD
jgi:lysophospholipase L1-like esterase